MLMAGDISCYNGEGIFNTFAFLYHYNYLLHEQNFIFPATFSTVIMQSI
jgi:hypothetical protein